MNRSRIVIIAALLLALVQIVAAMPPSPELLTRIESGQAQTPYFLHHSVELSARGVNQPRLIPYFENFHERHHLDQNFNVLVILVDFSDNTAGTAASYFDNLLFGNAQGNMAHYFRQISYNNLDVVTVHQPSSTGWRRAPNSYSYYVNNQNGFGSYPQNAQKLAEDAIALADPLVDFSNYDNDGDNFVDALFIIHAGTGAEYSGNNAHIWSHAWGTNSVQSVDGVYANAYTMEPEYWAAPGDMTCGVYAHEMGHMVFGLPDLYDTGNDSYGLGRWSLMAGGSWNGTLGNSPAHPDAWSRVQMGFVIPTVVATSSPGASIPAVANNATIFKLTSATGTSQYALVENRQQTGYDAGLPSNGLLIYHVDEATASNSNQWYPGHTSSGHYKVALEQADGLWQLEQHTNNGNSGDAFPGSAANRNYTSSSTPNSSDYSGAATGIAVQNISNSGATMTADLAGSSPSSITVTYPNGGETLIEGTTDTIRWSSTGISGNVRIDLNRTYPGGTWTTIVTSAPNTGSYLRNVPTGSSTTARIRIVSLNNTSISDISNANFTINAGTVTVTSPNGGETWLEGTTDTIRWTSTGFTENVKIELNRTYPTGTWVALVASAPNTGSYPRNVPTGTTNTARIRISRVSRADVNDVSNANFAISGGSIAVVSPNGGETWLEGTTDTLRWTSSGFTENVKIELNRSYPSGTWVTLVASAPNTGSYPRNVPTGATTSARVRISRVSRADVNDISNANFTIQGPTITVLDPNGGETWIEGTQDTIRWSSTNLNENVKIELNRSYPTGAWAVLVASAPNTGSYLRNVPTGASTAARVRISGVTRADVTDVSNANFTIRPPGSPPFEHDNTIASEFRLQQNYPNPFNPNTEIRFDLPEAINVELKVFNILGQEIVTLVDEVRAAGAYRVLWDGKNAAGSTVASGVYIYQIKTPHFTDAKKMLMSR